MKSPHSASQVDDRTLSGAARIFMRNAPPWVLGGLLIATVLARIWAGSFSPWDLVVLGGLLALHPFVEWIIHVLVLHARPWHWKGRRFDLRMARYHRAHHRDPWDLRWVFMPMPQAAIGLLGQMVLFWLILPSAALALTAMAFVAATGLLYEWNHFLIHTRYRPRTWLYRQLWRYHRLHHFKNERYWFGVTTHLADRVLRTMPRRDAVATSETCRTLGLASGSSQER